MGKDFYVSDGSRSHRVCNWYVSVGGRARRVVAAYIGDSQNRARLFYSPHIVSDSNYIIFQNGQFYHMHSGFSLSNEHHKPWHTTSEMGSQYFSIDNFLDDPSIPVPGDSILWEYTDRATSFSMRVQDLNFEITLGVNADYIVFLPVAKFKPGNLYLRMNSPSTSYLKCMGWSCYGGNPDHPNWMGYMFADNAHVLKYDNNTGWGIYQALGSNQSSDGMSAEYVFFWFKNPSTTSTQKIKISNIEAFAYGV